jgi:hypothetical protein
MHPIDQMSTAFVYSDAFKMTSGALYHRVITYLIRLNYSVFSSSSFSNPLPKPKSQIYRWQFLFKSKLLGLRSLWITLAECM